MFSTALCLCLALTSHLCRADEPPESVRILLNNLLTAVVAGDHAKFIADGSDDFKAKLTENMLRSVTSQLAPRMNQGYDSMYFGELNQQGCQVYLWKLVYNDHRDDTLAKLVLKDGKVAGFWLQ